MIEEYYENKEAEEAKAKILSKMGAGGTDGGGGRSQRGRHISVSTAPLKSAVFGGWYDQVRPLLRRRTGRRFQLPEPVYTEVSKPFFRTFLISTNL